MGKTRTYRSGTHILIARMKSCDGLCCVHALARRGGCVGLTGIVQEEMIQFDVPDYNCCELDSLEYISIESAKGKRLANFYALKECYGRR